jgi:hypothetical protein
LNQVSDRLYDIRELINKSLIKVYVAVSHGLGTCAVLSPTGLALGTGVTCTRITKSYEEVIRGSHTRKSYEEVIQRNYITE